MFKFVCKKVESMLSAYIENKLPWNEVNFVKMHLKKCPACYEKYITMKNVLNNLRFEYEKLLNEFEKIEADRIFNIREYESFYSNISPYLDDELNYDESIKFRKYLLKSKSARSELAVAYNLRNNIRDSFEWYKNNTHFNYAKNIVKKLKKENETHHKYSYKRAAIIIGLMALVMILLLFGYSYVNEAYANDVGFNSVNGVNKVETFEIPNEDEFIEFTFDEQQNVLLTAK